MRYQLVYMKNAASNRTSLPYRLLLSNGSVLRGQTHSKARPGRCVLPPDEFTHIISESLVVSSESLTKVAVTVFP